MKIVQVSLICVLVLGGCATPAGRAEAHVGPKPLFTPVPEYPVELRASGKQGKALVEFIVTTEGNVVEAKVIEADHPLFGVAALQAVRRWKFTPPRIGDRKVNDRLQIPIYFALEDKPNQPSEPTTMSVTTPAAQEPRRP